MATEVRIRLNNAAIDSLTLPGGVIYRLTESVALSGAMYARARAPQRTGALANSITGRMSGVNQSSADAIVRAEADHAAYVHEGTRGTEKRVRLYVGRRGEAIASGYRYAVQGGPRARPRYLSYYLADMKFGVAGQTANPFLRDGLADSLAAHRIRTHASIKTTIT